MKPSLTLLIAAAALAGCSSSSPPNDTALRSQLTQPKVDVTKIPQSQRTMVQGFIDRADQMRAQAKAHSGGG